MTERDELSRRCQTIEECYEFMLAYAAQGLESDAGTGTGSELRELLGRAVSALSGLAAAAASVVDHEQLAPRDRYDAFLAVLDRDARDALAAMELARAQASISSQLVDNLNASIHLRALLTDLFLIDEILKSQPAARRSADVRN